MKARIFSYFVLTIIGSVWISLSAQERNFKGDHKIYLSRIEEQIKSFYDVTIECVTDVENQSLLIENMKNEILTASCVCIPDFMNYSDADGMYSYENYLAHFMRQYSSLLKTSTMLEFRQEDLKIEKAVYTEDEQGVQFNVSFNNILADNESEKILYTSRSQAVIVFPKIHQLLNRKIRQISSWNRGGVKAVNTQTKEVKTEDAESIYQKGLSFYNEKNYVEAVKYFREAADLGYADAQWYLFICYSFGLGIPEDQIEAKKWHRKAAEQGHVDAQSNLFTFEIKDGVLVNFDETVNWYREAAEQGHTFAQFELGACYEYGWGVPKDCTEAIKWYQKAAEQGYALAQFALGKCYENGIGVPKEEGEIDMGCYGLGVPKDLNEAVRWYRKAAEQGDEFAKNALKRLGAK